jgi:hypothetical protein
MLAAYVRRVDLFKDHGLARRSYDALHSSPPFTVEWSAAATPELSRAK